MPQLQRSVKPVMDDISFVKLKGLKFNFSRLPTDFLMYQAKNADVSKRTSIFSDFILLLYRW